MRQIKILIITLIAFHFSDQCLSQIAKDIEVGLCASPNYGTRTVSSANGDQNNQSYLDEKSSTKGGVKFDLGLKFNYMLTNDFRLGLGLLYGQKGYNFNQNLTDTSTLNLGGGHTGRVVFSSIDVPINLSYKIVGSDTSGFQLWVGLGGTLMYVNSVSYYVPSIDYPSKSIITNEQKYVSADYSNVGLSPLQFATTLNVEFSYMPDPSIRLFLSPYFQYHLTNSSVRNLLITENLYQIGVQLGVCFNLTKLISNQQN